MKEKMIFWHRKAAYLAAVAVFLWGISGLLHPLMSWTNPRAASFMPPVVEAFDIPSVSRVKQALLKENVQSVDGLRVLNSNVQVTVFGQPRFFIPLATRSKIADLDHDRALMLARHYSGLQDAKVMSVELITSFSNQYTYINRYLPVWKVTFDDPRHISVYVDTSTDRLGAITDRRKVILQTLFQTIHTGQWLDGVEPLRIVLIALLVGSILSMAVAGIYMLVALRGKRRGMRKWHRVIAYAALFPLLMFPVSGLFHLFMQSPMIYGGHDQAVSSIDVKDMAYMPKGKADDLRLIATNGQFWWRAQLGQNATYVDAVKGTEIKGDEVFVRQMVGGDIISVTKTTTYSDEYGFAYKRLPVWRVDTGSELLFIEAKTGVIAARVNPLQVAETWTFARLHKWQFLDGFSEKIMGPGPMKNAVRDGIMVLFMLLGIAIAVIGLLIRRK